MQTSIGAEGKDRRCWCVSGLAGQGTVEEHRGMETNARAGESLRWENILLKSSFSEYQIYSWRPLILV